VADFVTGAVVGAMFEASMRESDTVREVVDTIRSGGGGDFGGGGASGSWDSSSDSSSSSSSD
jgi:uncharacterized membrane protein YgcG